MKKIVVLEKDFCEFYWKMKELYELGKQFKFGSGISLPSLFTEELCRKIYGLSKSEGTEFDAVDKEGNVIEIKATLSPDGKTTMSKAKFDILYWMYFDIEDNKVYIYKNSWENFNNGESFKEKLNNNNNRMNISLRKYMSSNHLVNILSFKK